MSGPRELEGYPMILPTISLSTAILRLLLPFLMVLAYFVVCLLVLAPDKGMILGGLMVAYMIPPSGKESIIPLGIFMGIPWPMMATTMVVQDVVTGLFMLLNLDYTYHLPYLGPWITQFLSQGKEFMSERPWLCRWNVLGLAFFVMLPFQGTGGVGATLVGWMMGLSPGKILLAIGMGAVLESLFFALGSELIWSFAPPSLVRGIEVFLVIVFITVLLLYLIRQWLKIRKD